MKIGARLKFSLLPLILLCALLLRLRQIELPFTDIISWRQSDTATIAENFYRGNWNIFLPEISWNGAEPNYVGYEFQTLTYLTALIYRVTGQQDWVARGVAVAFGIWGIFALYQLVRRVWDEQRAIVGAAVMAVLPGSVFVEQSFVPDPVMVSLVVTSFWLLVAYLQSDKPRYLVGAVGIGILGFLTKISGLLVGISMLYAILTLLHRQHQLRSRRAALLLLASLLTLAPVMAYYVWARHISLHYPPYLIGANGNWVWDDGLASWLQQGYFWADMYPANVRWLWGLPVGLLLPIGLVAVPYRNAAPTTGQLPWIFHWWLLGGVIFYAVGAKELAHNPWNFHLINPAVAVLTAQGILVVASGLHRLVRSLRQASIVAFILMVILTVGWVDLEWTYHAYAYDSYQMGLKLRQVTQPNDLVVTIADTIGDPVAIYYSRRRGWVFPPPWQGIDWTRQTLTDDAAAIQWFEELRRQGADWFGIANSQRTILRQSNPAFIQYIEQVCELYEEDRDDFRWVIYRITPLS